MGFNSAFKGLITTKKTALEKASEDSDNISCYEELLCTFVTVHTTHMPFFLVSHKPLVMQ